MDEVYLSNGSTHLDGDVLSKLMLVGNSGGFRKRTIKKHSKTKYGESELAYVVLVSTGKETEWTDSVDRKNRLVTYYGDNREPGNDIHNTKGKGNVTLNDVFTKLANGDRTHIPPFFYFEGAGGRNIKFIGLLVPGDGSSANLENQLEVFTGFKDGKKYQNYRAKFSILDANNIDRRWLTDLIRGDGYSSMYAPEAWKKWVENGDLDKSAGGNALPADALSQIKSYISQKGFSYESSVIENFYLCLKAKPFVILAGTSGTGKTRLVRLFAEAVGATAANGRLKQVAVRPDWSDSSDLFGHVDLNGKFVPGALTDFLEKAASDLTKPYFLCLDEMNLARVEYYLSDFLSVVETRDFKDNKIVADPIHLEKHADLTLPENLFVIGTVNMDETTFPFSRKVLDRANTIEFSFVDLMPQENDDDGKSVQPLDLDNPFFRSDYLTLKQCMQKEDKEFVKECCSTLCEFNDILKKANAHVGYRVRDEIVFYLTYNRKFKLLSENEAFDYEILQKILPRIQGSSAAIRDMIGELFQRCAGDYTGYQADSGEIYRKMFKVLEQNKDTIQYPRSAEKLAFMMRRYEEDGFTSYWL